MTTKWATTLGPMPIKVQVYAESSQRSYLKMSDGTTDIATHDTLFATEEGALTYMIQSCDTLIAYQKQKRDKLSARLKEIG